MKKYLLLLILSIVCFQDLHANHTKGGWMYYEYLGQGINDPSKLRYKIGLNLYIECGSTLIEPSWNFSFFTGGAPYNFIQDIAVNAAPFYDVSGCVLTTCYPCLSSIPTRCYRIINYETTVELAPSPDGYIIAKQRCCRVTGISNLQSPSNSFGATWTIKIPGLNQGATAPMNTSPAFIFGDTTVVCGDNPFTLNFKATDADGDSLAYSFTSAYDGGSSANPNPGSASSPPYNSVAYAAPYNGIRPLGVGVTIDPVSGLISGTAPPVGEYVICVLVKEYRNGVYIAESRKELHLKTATCNPLVANPNFSSVTCTGFTVTLTQNSPGNPTGYFWDFGDPASGPANTSTVPNPTHTFTDTGVFYIKLKVTVGVSCSDSIIKPLGVYPNFFPGFTSAPLCVSTPVQFTDTTYFRYGNSVAWRWDFGDNATLDDTSHLQNPLYTYPAAGNYVVTLTVTNDKGCVDIYTKSITISDNPLLSLISADSSYCALDSLQLSASGAGNFNWSPLINIVNANTATPSVFPTSATWYTATLTNASGCFKSDSLLVTPKNDLTNSITASTINICEEDTLQLSGISNKIDNLSWQWLPGAGLETPAMQDTWAWPTSTTNYTLRTTWGTHCVSNASKNIIVKPLALPYAGPDTALCNGQASIQLNASGGNSYQWMPATGLNNPNIRNPIASPDTTTNYIVTVGVTGCSKTRADTMVLTVRTLPAINTTNDTLICIIDTLQLSSTGTGNFVWTPNYMISNTNIANPLVSPDVDTTYYVKLTDSYGCYRTDSVRVTVRTGVMLNAGNDTSICRTDGFVLNPLSDGLYYQWTPSTYLNFDNIKNPVATPLSDITYHVVSSIGKCSNQDDINIKVVPYPVASAGADVNLCYGFSTQLQASGGSSYIWSPTTFLNDRLVSNPTVIGPTANIKYIVTVRDTLGCPKPVKDSVWVFVARPVRADAGPRDTTAVLGEPLYLSGSGGDSYTWSPPTWLNNPNSQNPVALPQDDIGYTLTATTTQGCIGTDFINIKLYKVDPDLYVPNAFTPNGDTKNEILKPILLGMRELHFFRIYNRDGRLVFSSTSKNDGWDGRFKGSPQDAGTFVWMAEGINYKGELRKKKGFTILIR
jgi:gliding motility-associated-like protein